MKKIEIKQERSESATNCSQLYENIGQLNLLVSKRNEPVTNCNELKMLASDRKNYNESYEKIVQLNKKI
jgi:hypothetical protein